MTERTTKTITFWVAVNQDGEHHIDNDCAQDAIDGVGGDAVRVTCINLTIELPTVDAVNIDVTVPVTQAAAQVTARVV